MAFAFAVAVTFASIATESCAASSTDPEAPPVGQTGRVPGGLVVDFTDGTTQRQIDEWERAWEIDLTLSSPEEGPRSGIAIASNVADVEAAIARVGAHPAVEVAEPLVEFQRQFVPNDPQYDRQWNLRMIQMPKAWETSRGKGVVIAVLDTGIAYEDHEDFRVIPDLRGVRFMKGHDFVEDDAHPNDDHGHGTHVAGTIAQATNNGEGVAGVAFEASLMPIKVLNAFGSGTSADIADGIRWAVDHGAVVLNLSLGGGLRSLVMERAIDYARKKGAVVVCAAGNTGRSPVSFPAAYPGAIAVGAVGPSGERAPYSSFGAELDVVAPGGDKREGEASGILQNTIDPRDVSKSIYASYQGTSMATPHVAGIAALLFAAGAKTPDEVEQALLAGAVLPKGQGGWSEQYGHGVVDASASLKAIGRGPVPGPLPPLDLGPLWSALALLAIVLLTLRPRLRPGYLNVLFRPTFFIPLGLVTVGLFFLRGFASGGDGASVLSSPLPDWFDIIFGRGRRANPLVYSALIPGFLALFAVKATRLRPVVAGLSLGFAGFLSYAAWAKAPALAYLPFTFLAIPWLLGHALVCLVIARALLRRDAAP